MPGPPASSIEPEPVRSLRRDESSSLGVPAWAVHEEGCRRRSSRSPVLRGALPRQGPGRVPHSHAGTKQTLSVGIRTHLTCPASRKVHLKTALPAERPAEGVGGVDSTHAPRPAGHPSQEFSLNLRFPLPRLREQVARGGAATRMATAVSRCRRVWRFYQLHV